MKPAAVAPRPRPKLPATRRSAVDAARRSAATRVKVRTWPAVPTNPKPAPPTARADEALPRTVDKRQAAVAECVHDIARDQDPFRTETIKQLTRREGYHCGGAHDRR